MSLTIVCNSKGCSYLGQNYNIFNKRKMFQDEWNDLMLNSSKMLFLIFKMDYKKYIFLLLSRVYDLVFLWPTVMKIRIRTFLLVPDLEILTGSG
jgi:hypothetical protein